MLGCPLPRALHEFHGLVGGRTDVVADQDPLLPPHEVFVHDECGGVLVFRSENQGCAFWGCALPTRTGTTLRCSFRRGTAGCRSRTGCPWPRILRVAQRRTTAFLSRWSPPAFRRRARRMLGQHLRLPHRQPADVDVRLRVGQPAPRPRPRPDGPRRLRDGVAHGVARGLGGERGHCAWSSSAPRIPAERPAPVRFSTSSHPPQSPP